MADRTYSRVVHRRAGVRRLLETAIAGRGARLDILDAGGGTGGFAVPLAELGHTVTVVDPSPDSLAALERRAAEASVSAQVRGLQGDAAGVLDVVAPDSYDVVLCHSVLEVVDDPTEALTALGRTARASGLVSILAANRTAAVLARVVAGRVAEAAALFADPTGRVGTGDPLSRRFTLDSLSGLVTAAGLRVVEVHGVRVLSDLVPGGLLDDDLDAATTLAALEEQVAQVPAYRDIATQLHVFAHPER